MDVYLRFSRKYSPRVFYKKQRNVSDKTMYTYNKTQPNLIHINIFLLNYNCRLPDLYMVKQN